MTIYAWAIIGFGVLVGTTWLICGRKFTRRQLGRLWGWLGSKLRRSKMSNSN